MADRPFMRNIRPPSAYNYSVSKAYGYKAPPSSGCRDDRVMRLDRVLGRGIAAKQQFMEEYMGVNFEDEMYG